MLSTIKSSINEAVNMRDDVMDDKENYYWRMVWDYLHDHALVQNADVCRLLDVSSATANRLLRGWVQTNRLERCRNGRVWAYRVKP